MNNYYLNFFNNNILLHKQTEGNGTLLVTDDIFIIEDYYFL